ncbi:MAG: FHA domain-containing protein [Deltaproteobacteria bacterium]|nr:FHA domain-containing protein [Deltaproteobacteria bacterium]MBW2378229.1 FHA domain-containing protein [Deltaproteobacteria bacterium]MBW2550048.1 FHA domain-containing protein [Deltaproteobacteria bacterium]MBW2626887.1 FHA domain-containing protein [Deltaproteobacteria bacterium]MBW2684740.1 FHA domain-containing protein [Deltaproteobacteria bacterium]
MGVRITVQSLWTEANPSSFVYEFAQSRVVIGRSRSADVQLPHTAVSGSHATIREKDAGYVLVDEGSTNGTRVNEIRVVPERPKVLRNHDLVDLGGYRLTIDVGVPVAQTMSARLTADFARRILAEQLAGKGKPELDAELNAIQSGPDERVDLLPIVKEAVSEPPPTRESRPSRPRQSRPDTEPPAEPVKLRRSEVAVYALAALVIASSIIAMALLMRP